MHHSHDVQARSIMLIHASGSFTNVTLGRRIPAYKPSHPVKYCSLGLGGPSNELIAIFPLDHV
jgi:hypothetical protein